MILNNLKARTLNIPRPTKYTQTKKKKKKKKETSDFHGTVSINPVKMSQQK